MIVINDIQTIPPQGTAATIGFFDGVHLGHRFLIDELKRTAAARNLPSAVITFPQHPRTVLHSDYQPKLLNSFEEKIELLGGTGIDYCIVLPFTPELSRLSAQAFIEDVVSRRYRVKTLLTGYDHRFGHNRTDGFEQYTAYGKACGVEVLRAPAFDAGRIRVSSSEVRAQLAAGNIRKANELLTYPYRLKGTIIVGNQIGRTLGFPTANIRIDEPFKVIPGIGIYAVRVSVDGEEYPGMLYIGNRPTLNRDNSISLEVNILNFSGNLYNRQIEVSFEEYIRENRKFGSLDELKQQLARDREQVLSLLANRS
ncbi:MAG: riboflavin biosynthesis protein RibF [Parabacteroides sp.]|nr:riboflavin biosynthesis protein RibF [Parabacteroides sp.]